MDLKAPATLFQRRWNVHRGVSMMRSLGDSGMRKPYQRRRSASSGIELLFNFHTRPKLSRGWKSGAQPSPISMDFMSEYPQSSATEEPIGMITRIEIHGFKTFENFSLDLAPLTAVVGPNASGKSNLFDAIRFISQLSSNDIFTSMQSLRGIPEELFRKTSSSLFRSMSFAIEVVLPRFGEDSFGREYTIRAQRLRYELELQMVEDAVGLPRAVVIRKEVCSPIAKKNDHVAWLEDTPLSYNAQATPFIRLSSNRKALEIKQDGPNRRGNPVTIPLRDNTRTALSTISTAEFPHLYALKSYLSTIRFLELNPSAARGANDRFEERVLRSDASNLATVLARLKEETEEKDNPEGVLSYISSDLSMLIPSVERVVADNDILQRQFAFGLQLRDGNYYSSRVISDGTLRLLALLTVLNDPDRRGTLCFEEPENGVHEGRMSLLVEILRSATSIDCSEAYGMFQVLLNTHSPAVMENLKDDEIVAADLVTFVTVSKSGSSKSKQTRMRTGVSSTADLFDHEKHLTRTEIERILKKKVADSV